MTNIVLENVRGSYVYVTSPQKRINDKTQEVSYAYCMQVIFPKDHPQIKALMALIEVAAKKKHGPDVIMKSLKLPFRDGDEENEKLPKKDQKEEYKNAYFINTSSFDKKPGLRSRSNGVPDEDEITEYCYSGAFFHVSINFYGFKKPEQKGVAVALKHVMLHKKGDRLDGSTSAEDDFATVKPSVVIDDDDDWDD